MKPNQLIPDYSKMAGRAIRRSEPAMLPLTSLESNILAIFLSYKIFCVG